MPNPAHVDQLTKAVCSWYVRKDSKLYDVDNLAVKLSKDDVQRVCVQRFAEEFAKLEISGPTLRAVFHRAIDQKHAIPDQTIPVWNGKIVCKPAESSRFVRERGAVWVNSWTEPAYRKVDAQPAMGVAGEFFDVIFPRDAEKIKVLDWLAWCLQNEGDKPTWAPFLYSESKGTGKSTFCELAARLFGEENSITQNSVDKLTGRFNMPILTRKLVISEELQLQQNSTKGNTLKTYITENVTTSERKGQDAERIEQCCCFLFTSNHAPIWIGLDDRRYYLTEVDHDGHAAGPKAREFGSLIARLKAEMEDDQAIASLYLALMKRKLTEGFSAKTLNIVEDATPLMKRVMGASEQTNLGLLRECLAGKGLHSIPDRDAANVVRDELGANINSTRHLMTELGWTPSKVKWGGCDYTRMVWTEKGHAIGQGRVTGPDGFDEPISDHFRKIPQQGFIE